MRRIEDDVVQWGLTFCADVHMELTSPHPHASA